jgi:hypothetical protein
MKYLLSAEYYERKNFIGKLAEIDDGGLYKGKINCNGRIADFRLMIVNGVATIWCDETELVLDKDCVGVSLYERLPKVVEYLMVNFISGASYPLKINAKPITFTKEYYCKFEEQQSQSGSHRIYTLLPGDSREVVVACPGGTFNATLKIEGDHLTVDHDEIRYVSSAVIIGAEGVVNHVNVVYQYGGEGSFAIKPLRNPLY